MTKKILDAWADAWDEVNAEREKSGTMRIQSFSEAEQYIRVKDVRYTLDEFNRIGNFLLGRELTDDQQVVLEWWVKKLNEEGEDADPLGVICAMQSYGLREEKIYDAAVNLTTAQQFQVLAAFAVWGMSQEANQ